MVPAWKAGGLTPTRVRRAIRPGAQSDDWANPTRLLMHYVYILLLRDELLYKGSTGNLRRRLKEHESGKVESTKNKKPIQLIHYECYKLKSDAKRREKYLKTTEGRYFLKQQIKDFLKTINM
ncbi:MAG: GIY-YIG nuclease family protein [Candidatus Falkowbacteria bacterium]